MIDLTSPPAPLSASREGEVGAQHAAPWFSWILALILFGAFALRLWNLDTQSLWHDEAWSVLSAYQPFTPIDPNYPPFFTVLLGGWIRLVGDSVWAMRYWSLLFGVATVAVMAVVARRWFGDRAAIIAAILIAVSPILWVFSQEIRSYVLVPLLALVLLALAGDMLSPHPQPLSRRARGEQPSPPAPLPKARGDRRVWLWLALTEIILLYTHNLSVPIVAWLNVTVIMALLFRRDWRRLRNWLLVQIGLLILYLPWLITQRPTGTPLNTPPTVSPTLVWDIWQSYFTGIKAMIGAEPGLMTLVAVFGVVGVIAIGAAVGAGFKPAPTTDPRKQRLLLALSQAILIPIFEIIIILAAHIDFHPRYFIAGVPATLLLIAVGLDRLAQRGVVLRVAAVSATVLAIGIGVYMARLVYGNPAYQHDDFRAIAQHLKQVEEYNSTTHNIATKIVIPYGWEPTLDYYIKKMGIKAQVIGIPLHSSAQTIIERLIQELSSIRSYHVELLTWYQLPADVRGAYPCFLTAHGYSESTFTAQGIKTEAFRYFGSQIPAATYDEVLPPNFGKTEPNFGKIQLASVPVYVSSDNTACIITQWRLVDPTQENWRISMRALNELGWEIAKADSDLLDDRQLPTSMWQQGQVATAFSLLRLPEGSPHLREIFQYTVNSLEPPMFNYDYWLRVSVYSDKTPHGLDVVDNGQVGKDAGLTSFWLNRYRYPRPKSEDIDIDLGDKTYLLRYRNLPSESLMPGQEIRVTLKWGYLADSGSKKVTVRLEGQGWALDSSAYLLGQEVILSWHELTIPANASGHATLKVTAPNGKTVPLAEYDITPIARTFTEPAAASRVNATFAGVGTLIGYTSPDAIKSGEALPLTLYWKPSTTPPTTLKVFVHLLAGKDYSNGIIAQSDAEPAGGQRPTTSWVAGEYITDPHTLTFNNGGYTGPAALSIGLYDATTGKRVLLDNGDDHIVLPITIMVK